VAASDFEGPVAEYFAINLRAAREAIGLSQTDLAERIRELGHPCTQATIWKLEQGHREPKLSEAVAIGRALGLMRWTELTLQPATFQLEHTVDQWRRQVNQLAAQTRAAAAAQLEALVNLAFAVRKAQDAGMSPQWTDLRSGGWLELTPEATILREVLGARVEWDSQDAEDQRRLAEEDELGRQIMRALETCGVPLAIRPDAITFEDAESLDLA
jgi:transcriptional regulator with XRE-family HTH domain